MWLAVRWVPHVIRSLRTGPSVLRGKRATLPLSVEALEARLVPEFTGGFLPTFSNYRLLSEVWDGLYGPDGSPGGGGGSPSAPQPALGGIVPEAPIQTIDRAAAALVMSENSIALACQSEEALAVLAAAGEGHPGTEEVSSFVKTG